MAVTSQIKLAATVGEARVQDWQGAGLIKPSVIKPIITTIEKGLVLKMLGQLKEVDRQTLRSIINSIIG